MPISRTKLIAVVLAVVAMGVGSSLYYVFGQTHSPQVAFVSQSTAERITDTTFNQVTFYNTTSQLPVNDTGMYGVNFANSQNPNGINIEVDSFNNTHSATNYYWYGMVGGIVGANWTVNATYHGFIFSYLYFEHTVQGRHLTNFILHGVDGKLTLLILTPIPSTESDLLNLTHAQINAMN